METSGGNPVAAAGTGAARRYGVQFSASNFIQAPISTLLEYSGILRNPRSSHHESEPSPAAAAAAAAPSDGEVSIRIIGAGDHDGVRVLDREESIPMNHGLSEDEALVRENDREGGDGEVNFQNLPNSSSPQNLTNNLEGEANGRDSSYQRYDIQQAARWIEQILPFSLLLLVVFIRQHLQGSFFVTIWIAAVMFKSNDILRKQTALKGERKISVLVGITLVFIIHVFGVYWWYKNDDLLYPLILLPPKEIPPFWHAIFIIMVNGRLATRNNICTSLIKTIFDRDYEAVNLMK